MKKLLKKITSLLKVDSPFNAIDKESCAWIFGNGESLRSVDVNKFTNLIGNNDVLCCCNGFFYSDKFSSVFRQENMYYFLSDPLIFQYLDFISKRNGKALNVEDIKGLLYPSVSDQAFASLTYDIVSINKALTMENLNWCVPYGWLPVLRRIGVEKIYCVSPYFISNALPNFARMLYARFAGKLLLKRFNPIGPAVLNIAITGAALSSAKAVYVVGHNDNLDLGKFRYTDGAFCFKYDYFWTNNNTFYRRSDDYVSFMSTIIETMLVEYVCFKRFSHKVKYITDAHYHLLLHDLTGIDIFYE